MGLWQRWLDRFVPVLPDDEWSELDKRDGLDTRGRPGEGADK